MPHELFTESAGVFKQSLRRDLVLREYTYLGLGGLMDPYKCAAPPASPLLHVQRTTAANDNCHLVPKSLPNLGHRGQKTQAESELRRLATWFLLMNLGRCLNLKVSSRHAAYYNNLTSNTTAATCTGGSTEGPR
eukprot:Lankesteria_metandrocarpae@DN9501_c0_g1_i1.p1